MENQILKYLLLIILFVAGSIYNFKIRKQCVYRVRLTKPKVITLIVISLVFCVIAYISGNLWENYILIFSGITFIISGVLAEGIHKDGIYYLYGRGILVKLAKWEDIEDVEIDINQQKLKSFKVENMAIFANHYYNLEDINEINKFIEE